MTQNLELWVNEQHGNIRYLIFNQIYKNIPVWNGRLDFRYRLNGDLVLLGNDIYPFINISTTPSIDADQAIFNAQIHVGFNETLEDEIIDEYSELRKVREYLDFDEDKKIDIMSGLNAITEYFSQMDGAGLG